MKSRPKGRQNLLARAALVIAGLPSFAGLASLPTKPLSTFQSFPFLAGEPASKPVAKPSTRTASPSRMVLKSFASTKYDADKCLYPDEGVVIWQFYIDHAKDKLDEAKAELKVWIARRADNAEQVAGKWIGGADKTALEAQVQEKIMAAAQAVEKQQVLQAVKFLQEADKLYPNSFEVKFLLGYYAIFRFNPASPKMENFRSGQDYFEKALKLNPDSPEARSNLGLCLHFQRKFVESVNMMYSACKLNGDKEFVENLLASIKFLPESSAGVRRRPDVKDAIADASLMAAAKNVTDPTGFSVLPFRERAPEAPAAGGEPTDKKGPVGSGSGEVVSADGYIITNKHVARAGNTLMVRLNVGTPEETQKTAEVIYTNDEQDLALIKIKPDQPLAFLKYASYDNPDDGIKCFLLGYPLAGARGMYYSMKITDGIVASGKNGAPVGAPDVTMTAKANHGNSGGPIVDEYGRIMAVLAEGNGVGAGGDVYGSGISSGRVRHFLANANVTLDSGAVSPGDAKMDAAEIIKHYRQCVVLIMIFNE